MQIKMSDVILSGAQVRLLDGLVKDTFRGYTKTGLEARGVTIIAPTPKVVDLLLDMAEAGRDTEPLIGVSLDGDKVRAFRGKRGKGPSVELVA